MLRAQEKRTWYSYTLELESGEIVDRTSQKEIDIGAEITDLVTGKRAKVVTRYPVPTSP